MITLIIVMIVNHSVMAILLIVIIIIVIPSTGVGLTALGRCPKISAGSSQPLLDQKEGLGIFLRHHFHRSDHHLKGIG